MIKIAFLTPTWERAHFLAHSWVCVQSQRFEELSQPIEARWFILDDSREPHPLLQRYHKTHSQPVTVDYHWLAQRAPLGWKRNHLNDMALQWGADYLCSIDDDDWYGVDYAQHMIKIIDESPDGLAGSSENFYLHVATGKIVRFPPCGAWHSCNDVLCYNAAAAMQSRYLDERSSGEEPAFLKGRKVAQLPNILQYHLGVVHAHNTVPKHKFAHNPQVQTSFSLDDVPMLAASRTFYRQLLSSQ